MIKNSSIEEVAETTLFQSVGDICAAVNSVTNTRDLLSVSLKKTMDLFSAKRGSIFMLDVNGKHLTLKIAEGMERSEAKEMVKRMGEGVVGQVAQSKKPIFVDDIAQDRRFKHLKPRGNYRTPSFICAPLLVKDKLIGVINITDKESGHRFNRNEMQLLDFLSTQIALNYRRVELYNRFKIVLRETRHLKTKLGKTDKEAEHLKRQIIIHEKLATLGKLAGGIAHEFNNPLDGVLRYTNLSIEHLRDDEVVRGYLIEIKHGLNRMANIVKNLLACCRTDVLYKEKADIKLIIDHSIKSLESFLFHRNVKIYKKIDAQIPMIYDHGLERIFINLLRNAVDSMKDGGRISIHAKYAKRQLVLDVQDNGCGIPENQIDQIFEPFFTTKDIDKGCGLGLTIVSEIVKSYEGKISVESRIGEGTTFTITLPVE